ncbi:MAG: hypothetical protein ACKOTE_09040, partial [Opitutaceae bacterium]
MHRPLAIASPRTFPPHQPAPIKAVLTLPLTLSDARTNPEPERIEAAPKELFMKFRRRIELVLY